MMDAAARLRANLPLAKPGARLQVLANQGWRDAVVLAVQGPAVLVEYMMPKGTTALRILQPVPGGVAERPIGYNDLPTKWLQAIVDAGQDWEGNPQQGHVLPTAADVLEGRTK
jgi:hypothetical protein